MKKVMIGQIKNEMNKEEFIKEFVGAIFMFVMLYVVAIIWLCL